MAAPREHHLRPARLVERDTSVALGEAVPVGAHHEADVGIARWRAAELSGEPRLARSRRQQVVAASDVRYAGGDIVDDDRQVVRKLTVAAD